MNRSRYRGSPSEFMAFGATLYVGGRKFRLRGSADLAARGFLSSLEDTFSQAEQERFPLRLYTLRADLRKIIRAAPVDGLVSCLPSRDARVRSLALWLLGRCHVKRAIPAVALYSDDPDASVRKEALRALGRLGAWVELHFILGQADSRFMPTARPFRERMARFAKNVTSTEGSGPIPWRSRMATFWRVLPGRRSSPKSAEYIRLILERIRALLHGPPSGN